MTYKQAQKIAAKTTAPRFGLLMENGNGVWIQECISANEFGRLVHKKRYRGCFWRNDKRKSLASKAYYSGKGYAAFNLAQQLYRTDWSISIVSSQVLDLILA